MALNCSYATFAPLWQAEVVTQHRQQVLQAAYQSHPKRFVHGLPLPPSVPTEVWINPPITNPQPQEILL